MVANGPYKEGFSDSEPIHGEELNNLVSRKSVVITGQNLTLSETSAHRAENGTYTDSQTEYVHTDHAGNPLPADPSQLLISWSGLYTTPEKSALCTSTFHRAASRIIALDQDGHQTANGAICFRCASWVTTLNVVVLLLTTGIFAGIILGLLKYNGG